MSRRLRILQIFNRYLHYGGEEGSVYRIGDALQQRHDVEYFLYSTAELMGPTGAGNGIRALASVFHNRRVLDTLRRYQNVGKFEVWQIHNVFPAMSPVVYREAFSRGIPIVHYLHNYRLSCVNGMFLNHGVDCQSCIGGNFWEAARTACWHDSHVKSGLMGLVLSGVRRMDLFAKVLQWIAISEAQKQIHIRMGLPAERIRVVHHFYQPQKGPIPFGPGRDVVFVGRLSQEKGVHVLIEAWNRLRPKSSRLRIVGEGPALPGLRDQVERDSIPGVVFEGFKKRDEMEAVWKDALFAVVPSVWEEPFGMTVLEAWAQGRAVLASAIGALPELVREGVTGRLVAAGDPGAWAAAMDQMLSHPEATTRMGFQGRNCLEDDFNISVWLEKMTSIYQDLNL